MESTILQDMKTLHAKLSAEVRRLEKAMAALSPEPKVKAAPAERAPGAPKRGRPKKAPADTLPLDALNGQAEA
jgi:hypothetical protein